MPFPEFTPSLDEKFKYASFGLTRLNNESILPLIVTSSSLTFLTPSFVSGSLVSQTTNPQIFDVYSVVSVTGNGANPFTLNSNGTYNYQIPTPLPTTNLVLTYQVTRGTQTVTATLTLIYIQQANFKVTSVPTLSASGIPLATQTLEAGSPIISTRVTGNTQTSLFCNSLNINYKRFRFVIASVGGGGSLVSFVLPGAGINDYTLRQVSTGGSVGSRLRITWDNGGSPTGIDYNTPSGIPGTWEVIFTSITSPPLVTRNGVVMSGIPSVIAGTVQAQHRFNWGSGLESFEAWVN